MNRFTLADERARSLKTPYQIGGSASTVVAIRRHDVDQSFDEHSLGPIFWFSSKSSDQRTRGNLHPYAMLRELLDELIAWPNPSESLGVGQNRLVASHHEAKKRLVEMRGGDVVGRFDEQVTGVRDRQQTARLQSCDHIGHDMNVRARDKSERDSLLVQFFLQSGDGAADLRAGIVIDARHDVRSAGLHRDAALDGHSRHCERNQRIRRSVVDSGEKMAVKVDHRDDAPGQRSAAKPSIGPWSFDDSRLDAVAAERAEAESTGMTKRRRDLASAGSVGSARMRPTRIRPGQKSLSRILVVAGELG